MKRVALVLLTLVMLFTLSSCANIILTPLFYDNDSELADARIEQLFEATQQQDKATFKKMFSQKAINEADNIDDEIDCFFSFVQGTAISWNRDESPRVFEVVEYGRKSKQLITWYTLNTDKQSYLVLLVDYPVDTMNSENVGLYSIRILKLEDENRLIGTVEEWILPGIYVLD